MIKKESEIKIGIAWNAFTACFEDGFKQKIPVLKKPTDLVEYDLIIFSGGEDISPAFYDGSRDLSYGVNPERDKFERETFDYCRQLGKKTLGVCRGHQLINAVMGANFVQDLRFVEGVTHTPWHRLENKTSDLISHFTSVNSLHHQGISSGFNRLTCTSFFGKCKSGGYIVESSENDYIVTVQFHPEFMENAESEEFFRKIIKWAKEKKTNKNKLKSSLDELVPEWITSVPEPEPQTTNNNNESYFGTFTSTGNTYRIPRQGETFAEFMRRREEDNNTPEQGENI
jgi:putative glutamine amidotransferase